MQTSDLIALGALGISSMSFGLTVLFEVMKKPKLEYFLRVTNNLNGNVITQVNVTFEIYKAGYYPCVLNKIEINGNKNYLGADAIYIADVNPRGKYVLPPLTDGKKLMKEVVFIDTANRRYEVSSGLLTSINQQIKKINQ